MEFSLIRIFTRVVYILRYRKYSLLPQHYKKVAHPGTNGGKKVECSSGGLISCKKIADDWIKLTFLEPSSGQSGQTLWEDACLFYFQQFSQKSFPGDIEPTVHDLRELKRRF